MKPDTHKRRSRDTRPLPPWRGGHPATACKAALLLLALALPALGQDPATNAVTQATEGPIPVASLPLAGKVCNFSTDADGRAHFDAWVDLDRLSWRPFAAEP